MSDELFKKLLGAAIEGYAEGKLARQVNAEGKLGHEESQHCWCCPKLHYKDPVNGNEVWVHNEPENAN